MRPQICLLHDVPQPYSAPRLVIVHPSKFIRLTLQLFTDDVREEEVRRPRICFAPPLIHLLSIFTFSRLPAASST